MNTPNDNLRVVGLSVNQKTVLPQVLFKGHGKYADKIQDEFRHTHSPHRVVKDKDLIDKLFRLPVGANISPDLYELVAIILVYVFSVKAKLKEKSNA